MKGRFYFADLDSFLSPAVFCAAARRGWGRNQSALTSNWRSLSTKTAQTGRGFRNRSGVLRSWATTREKSSLLLQSQLKAAGFSVESGVADEPTGFIASYGQGKPVIRSWANSMRCRDCRSKRCLSVPP